MASFIALGYTSGAFSQIPDHEDSDRSSPKYLNRITSGDLQEKINQAIQNKQEIFKMSTEFPGYDSVEMYAPVYIIDAGDAEHRFEVDGDGFTLFAGPSFHTNAPMGPYLGIIRGSNVTIQHLNFAGPGAYPAINMDPDTSRTENDKYDPPPTPYPAGTPQPEASGFAVFFRNTIGFQIAGCTISDFSSGGILARFCRNGLIGVPEKMLHLDPEDTNSRGAPDYSSDKYEQVRALRNHIINIRRVAILCDSSILTTVCGNFISNNIINYHCNDATNAYGISFSRNYIAGGLDVTPASGRIIGNEVLNVRTWVGIDVHGGGGATSLHPSYGIFIINNTVTDCNMGVSLQYDEFCSQRPQPTEFTTVEKNYINRSANWPRQPSQNEPNCYDWYSNRSWHVTNDDESDGEYLKSLFGPAITSAGAVDASRNVDAPNQSIHIRYNTIDGYGFVSTLKPGLDDSQKELDAGGQINPFTGAINILDTVPMLECYGNVINNRSGIGISIGYTNEDQKQQLSKYVYGNHFTGTTYKMNRVEDPSYPNPTDEIAWILVEPITDNHCQ